MSTALLLTVYILTFTVGFPANAFTLTVLVAKSRRRQPALTAADLFLLNLAVADLLLLLFLPFKMAEAAAGMVWPLPAALCPVVNFWFYSSAYLSSLFLAALSVRRYLGVAFPLRSRGRSRPGRILAVSAVMWLLACGHCSVVFVAELGPRGEEGERGGQSGEGESVGMVDPRVDPIDPKVEVVDPKVEFLYPKVNHVVPKVDPVDPKVDPKVDPVDRKILNSVDPKVDPKVDPVDPKVDPKVDPVDRKILNSVDPKVDPKVDPVDPKVDPKDHKPNPKIPKTPNPTDPKPNPIDPNPKTPNPSDPKIPNPKAPNPATLRCYDDFSPSQLRFVLPLRLEFFFVLFLAPFSVTVFCYVGLVRALIARPALPAAKRRRAVGLAVATVVIFGLCFAPYNVSHVVGFWQGRSPSWRVYATLLSSLNAALDPLVVYCSSGSVRQALGDAGAALRAWWGRWRVA